MEAVNIDNPPPRAQLALTEAAYAPGTRWVFNDYEDVVMSIAVSPDGRYAALGVGRYYFKGVPVAEDNTIRLIDMQTGQQIRTFTGHRDKPFALSFSPDGRYLVSGSLDPVSGSAETAIILWDVSTGEAIRHYRWDDGVIGQVAFTPDGRHFLSQAMSETFAVVENSIILWDVETGEQVRTLAKDVGPIPTAVISTDGRYVAVLLGEPMGDPPQSRVLVLNSMTGELVREFTADGLPNTGAFTTLSLSAENPVLFLGNPSGGFSWSIETGEQIGVVDIGLVASAFGNLTGLAISPDGRRLVISTQGDEVHTRDLNTFAEINRFRAHSGIVSWVTFTPDGQGLISAADDGVRLWNLQSGAFVREYESPPFEQEAFSPHHMRNVAFMADGHSFLSFTRNGTLLVRKLESGHIIQHIQQQVTQSNTWGMDIAPDGRAVLIGTFLGTAELYDLASGQIIRTFSHWQTPPTDGFQLVSIDISPDGRTALTASQSRMDGLVLWDLNTGAELHRFETSSDITGGNESNHVLSMSYSPDGSRAIVGRSDGRMILYDLQTYTEVRRYGEDVEGHTHTGLFDVEFSPDGQLIVSASGDSTLILWETETGRILHRLIGHNAEVRGADFSPDGKLIVSVSFDRTIILWDVATGEPIRRFVWEDGNGTFSVAFSPDGQYVLAGGVGQTSLWHVDATLDDLISWTESNRFVPEPTCIQRELYRLQPECVNGVDATLIP
jgi:WD40 repeat protein